MIGTRRRLLNTYVKMKFSVTVILLLNSAFAVNKMTIRKRALPAFSLFNEISRHDSALAPTDTFRFTIRIRVLFLIHYY